MLPEPTLKVIATLIAVVVAAGAINGCSKDNGSTAPNNPSNAGRYGKGELSFAAPEAGGLFSVSGSYKTSSEFQTDTLSEGAGGFVYDTSDAGKPIQARFMAYSQSMRGNSLDERLLVLSLDNAAGPLSVGDYTFTVSGSQATAASAYALLNFFSDSLGVFETFQAKAGTLSLTTLDMPTNHAKGTFSGTFLGPFPDTTKSITVADGSFDITFVRRYFDY